MGLTDRRRNNLGFETPDLPVASPISRLGSVDFVAVLPPGIFTLFVTHTVASGRSLAGHDHSLWSQFQQISSDALRNPLILLSVLFVSYFFGSILRAYPVEWIVSKFHIGRRRIPRSESNESGRRERGRRSISFGKSSVFGHRPDIIPRATINGWKEALHHRSPEAYAYFRTVEARSRFAAAMLWAGALGLGGSAICIALVGFTASVSQLALLSALLMLVFGSQIRKICRQEVAELLSLSEATRRPAAN